MTITVIGPSTRGINGFVWIPPQSAIYKLEIVRTDGTLDDVTNYILDGTEIRPGATETIGTFKINIENSNGNFTNLWVAGNIINLYADYGSSATTNRFKGKIDRISNQYNGNYILVITGRVFYSELREITVTKAYSNVDAKDIVVDLFSTYASSYNTASLVSVGTNLTVAFQGKPFWDCIYDICQSIGYDCYIDPQSIVIFRQTNTVSNSTDAIVQGQNLLDVGEFGTQTDEVRNRIIVYGAEYNGFPLIWTVEDTTSQTTYGVKEEVITNSNLTTIEQVQEYASYVLSLKKDPPNIGKITSYILCTLAPSELIKISDQYAGLISDYPVVSFTHIFGHTDVPRTEVTINREPINISKLFKGRFNTEQNTATLNNQNDLRFSYLLTFDDDTYTDIHSNTSVSEGYLITSTTNGTFTSIKHTATNDITAIEVKAEGDNLPGNVTYNVSFDNGVTYQTLLLNTKYTTSDFISPGKELKIKINMTNTTTKIGTVNILYK